MYTDYLPLCLFSLSVVVARIFYRTGHEKKKIEIVIGTDYEKEKTETVINAIPIKTFEDPKPTTLKNLLVSKKGAVLDRLEQLGITTTKELSACDPKQILDDAPASHRITLKYLITSSFALHSSDETVAIAARNVCGLSGDMKSTDTYYTFPLIEIVTEEFKKNEIMQCTYAEELLKY
jgi:hypothetical protein